MLLFSCFTQFRCFYSIDLIDELIRSAVSNYFKKLNTYIQQALNCRQRNLSTSPKLLSMPFCVEFGIAVTKLFSGRFYLDLMVLQTVLLLVYNFILPMEQPFNKKTPLNSDKDEKRLTTAPLWERPKHSDTHRNNNIQLPGIRGRNGTGRDQGLASRDVKRGQLVKRQQVGKVEHEGEEMHKRPQTSKGSRNIGKKESQYYEQGEDDLIITSLHNKADLFKKK